MMYLNLNEAGQVFKPFWLWSFNHFNWVSFWNRNYLDKTSKPVIEKAKSMVQTKLGHNIDEVCLATNLSYFGYCFNPISIYCCYTQKKLTAIIAEVTNTPWLERKCYVLKPTMIKPGIYKTHFQKTLHVSPFLDMDYEYNMTIKLSADSMIVHIDNRQNQSVHFDATLALNLKSMNHVTMAIALLRFPLMPIKTIFAIHWQALKLWLKGNPVFTKGKTQ